MENEKQLDEEFKPKGAMAFFIALLLFFIATYFSLYFLMLNWG